MGYSAASNGIAFLALFSAIFIGVVFYYFTNLTPQVQVNQYSLDSYVQYLPQEAVDVPF